jgi:cytochrome c-type biogenesis protein CcmH/NrfG
VLAIYQQQLAELVRDRDELLAQVAEQIWANSIIARRKFRLANLAVISIIAAAVALGCVFVMKI